MHSTGLTHVLIHTLQTSHKGTTRYKYSTSLGYTSSSLDKLVIMITAGKHSMQERRFGVNDTRQCVCYNLQTWTQAQATTVKNLHSNTTRFRTEQD